jgi:signal transduction histidine kinase
MNATETGAAPSPPKKLILIVDDLAENLQVLAGHLTGAGYEVMPASSGQRALAIVQKRRPDLILLDVTMPEMDGYTVCRNLKSKAETAEIPVIFITARTEVEDVVLGLEVGAQDYITKPFNPKELLARVRNHLELKASRDLLVTYNSQLHRISEHLKKMNEDKNRFLSIVSHDIRGAFGNVVSVSKLLADAPEAVDSQEANGLLRDLGIEAEHMIALAQNLLNTESIERGELRLEIEAIELKEIVAFSLQAHQLAAHAKEMACTVEGEASPALGDRTACRQILNNLVSNAVKYSPRGSEIRIRLENHHPDKVRVSVYDQGPGLSEADQKRLFQPFLRLSTKSTANEHSVGLGLSIVKRMAEAMGGGVECESSPGHGAVFHILLPRV